MKKYLDTELKVLNIVMHIVAIIVLVYLIVAWKSIPDEIPAHYNAGGEIDDYGDKGLLFFIVILQAFIYLMHWLIMYIIPNMADKKSMFSKKAYPKATDEDFEKAVLLSMKLVAWMDVFLFVMFSGIIYAMSKVLTLGVWFTVVFIVGLSVEIIYFLLKIYRQNKEIEKRKRKSEID